MVLVFVAVASTLAWVALVAWAGLASTRAGTPGAGRARALNAGLLAATLAASLLTCAAPVAPLVASFKDYDGGAFQEVHRHGLATGAAGVAVVFGGLPTQNHPPFGDVVKVGPGVTFDWHSMAGNPVYVASIRGPPGSQGYDVFTTRQGFAVPAGIPVQVLATYRWKVRASTAFATVDEAAGPGGYLGGAGAFERAESGEWTFTTAP